MEIRHFRYFLAVARQRNFTRAAEQLGIAPPTLSRQIQDMETTLGTRLFIRRQREVSLTEAGAALLIEAEATVPGAAKSVISNWVMWRRRCIRGCCSARCSRSARTART